MKNSAASEILPKSASSATPPTVLSEKTDSFDDHESHNVSQKHNGLSSAPSERAQSRLYQIALLFAASCIVFLIFDHVFHEEYQVLNSTLVSTPVLKAAEYARAVIATPLPTNTGVLECFQVYQPVLTPSGPTDDTVSSDGETETETLATVAPPASCTVVLMDHVFAYSYGEPFVGKCHFQSVLISSSRQLASCAFGMLT